MRGNRRVRASLPSRFVSRQKGKRPEISDQSEARHITAAATKAGQYEDRRHQGLPLRSSRSTGPTRRWRRTTDTAILPARPRKPRDKAKVEQAVLIVERWLIGRLRQRSFHSLAEVNAAIGELMPGSTTVRPIRRLGVTRRQLLEEIDRPALKPLPVERLRVRGMEAVPGRRRLSRRRRRPLLQRPAPLPARRGRGAADGADRRESSSAASGSPPILRGGGNRKHTTRCRAHAFQPSPLRRLDDRAHPRRRAARSARRRRRCASRSSNPGPIPNRASGPASASSVSRAPTAPSASKRRRSAPSRSAPGPTARSNPSSTTSSIGGRANAGRGRDADPPSQHPRAALLQLRRTRLAQTSHPRSASSPRPSRNGQGLRRTRRRRGAEGARPRRMARPSPRSRGSRGAGTSAWRRG